MTPQLQQAIKLLQLSNQELGEFVEQELEQNPLLERDESETDPAIGSGSDASGPQANGTDDHVPLSDGTAAPVDKIDPFETPSPFDTPAIAAESEPAFDGEAADTWNASEGADGSGDHDRTGDAENWQTRNSSTNYGDDLPGLEQTLGQEITLREHLMQQLMVDIADPIERMIGRYLIDLLEPSGYLLADLDEAAALLGCPIDRIEATLLRLQRFDPPGIFARSLSECLAIQLAERDRLDPAMRRLVENLPMLANRESAALMRLCGVDAEDFSGMVAEIRALNPKPGLAFDGAVAQPIVPDILLRGSPLTGWAVELNADTLPRVLVNTRYYSKVSRAVTDKTHKEYLTERFQSANWLVKSLHQRANTILRVATEIVRQQEGFFARGVTSLRPLILRDIAEAIGMHESTVSRVTTNKYMTTPRGIFELKYFFTSSIPAANGGDSHSAEAVRFRIKGLIDAEQPTDVLSDDKIVEILHQGGIDIARRTVAKYREAMRIPSSVLRRRDKSLRI